MSPKIKICKEPDCNDQASTKGFCRYHYLKNWSSTRRHKKKAAGDLNRYVEGLVEKHPDDYLHEISKDINRWGEGDAVPAADEFSAFEDLSSEDNLDSIIDNLKVDDDY